MIFGITGLKGAGKDTAGAAIISALGSSAIQVNFADPLKEAAASIFGLTATEMQDRELKEQRLARWPYVSPRHILQRLGTEALRENFPGVWIEAWKRRIAASPECHIVTTDYRFGDEADALLDAGAVMLRVVRPGLTSDGHASEEQVGMLPARMNIYNDAANAEEFQAHVLSVLRLAGVLPPAPEPVVFRENDYVSHVLDDAKGRVVAVSGGLAAVLWDGLSEPIGCPVCDLKHVDGVVSFPVRARF
jgi:hypothetical protein